VWFNWVFIPANARRMSRPPFTTNPLWGSGHHLPGMFRSSQGASMYTRMCVPIDETTCRVIYYHSTRPGSLTGRVYERLHFALWHNWMLNIQFSNQDVGVMVPQRYDTPEKLSGTDAEIIQWRKLLQRVAIEGRQVLKKLQAAELADPTESTGAEEFAEELLKEQGAGDVAEFFAGSAARNGDS
jgi:hypothetical protein